MPYRVKTNCSNCSTVADCGVMMGVSRWLVIKRKPLRGNIGCATMVVIKRKHLLNENPDGVIWMCHVGWLLSENPDGVMMDV